MVKKAILLCLVGILSVPLYGCSSNDTEAAKESKPVEIYLTRHGKTMLNNTDRVQGWADAPLTEDGIEVVQFLGEGLKDIKFEKVYSSDSGRAIETAKIVLDKSGQSDLEIIQRKELRESCFGEFEGELNSTFREELAKANNMTIEEFMQRFDVDVMLDTCKKIDKSKQAESTEEVSKRIRSEVDKIIEEASKDGGGNVLLVSHGISLMGLLYTIEPEALNEVEEGLHNASVSKIVYKDGKYSVESVNDMSYVEKGKDKK
ncbi:histidine phosphatase family protein [[Clostridium] dakarense]|uniref:histidine phosphatase family protein n=1 Tax=Faecalimicrobium dakarense TaxID=1301100 RepID=UPI0004B2A857|nr:histidine phosphatase family protein [[Clostridium] dakarense]